MRSHAFKLLEKGALEFRWAVTTELRQMFFSTGPQRTNWSLQTGLGSAGCSLQRNQDSLMEEVDLRGKKQF